MGTILAFLWPSPGLPPLPASARQLAVFPARDGHRGTIQQSRELALRDLQPPAQSATLLHPNAGRVSALFLHDEITSISNSF